MQAQNPITARSFKRRRISKLRRHEAFCAYMFIAPMIIGLAVLSIYAFGENIYLSFTKSGAFGSPKWLGMKNYQKLLTDDYFWICLKNTLIYAFVGTPLVVIFSTLVASLLNTRIRGRTVYRTLVFIPAVTMPAAVGLLWRWLLNSQYGIVNHLLGYIGVVGPSWLSDPNIVKWSILLVLVWSMSSYYVIIMLAGLQGISPMYYDAAKVDGANRCQIFFRVTVPLLTPMLFFTAVMAMIGILQIFDFIYLMLQRTAVAYQYAMSLVSYFYDLAFSQNNRGYASAVSIVLCVIIIIITAVQMIAQKYWVHYDD